MMWSFCHAVQKKKKQTICILRKGGWGERGGEARVLCNLDWWYSFKGSFIITFCLKVINGTAGAIFLFTSTYYFLTNCFHGVCGWLWAATAVYKVFRKVLSSLLLKNPWHGERRTCKGNLLYILYIWWPLTTKGHSVRYVNEQPLWERQGALGEKYLSLSLSEYEYYIKLGIGPDM